MLNRLLFFLVVCSSSFISGCSFEKDNVSYYVVANNFGPDLYSCYSQTLLLTTPEVKIEGKENLDVSFRTFSKKEADSLEIERKIVVDLSDKFPKEGTRYHIEIYKLKDGKWERAGAYTDGIIREIDPEKPPYGLDIDEICQQLVTMTIALAEKNHTR